MANRTASPDFDCLKGEDRFFVKSSAIYGDRSQDSNVYDHLQAKWFLVAYPAESVDPRPNRTSMLEDEDDKPVSDENVIKDLAPFAHKMGDHNVLSRDQGGNWHTSESPYVDLTRFIRFERYTGPPADSVRLESLDITGAVAPVTYVVGHWLSIYKPIITSDCVSRARTAIDFLQTLQGHPHINPLDHVVIDETGHIRGYTVPYLPNGTLEARKTLRVDWFLQLARTADDINFTYVKLA
jgi:hypothetical protein